MTSYRDLFLSILSMDSYNRGAEPDLTLGGLWSIAIGDASVIGVSPSAWQNYGDSLLNP